MADSVVWSPAFEIYGQYGPRLQVQTYAISHTMTAFLLGVAPLPLRHNDDHWDDVAIFAVHSVYLPMVERMAENGQD
jgi:hypothetical protein